MPVYLIIKLKTELMIDCVSMCVCESVASSPKPYIIFWGIMMLKIARLKIVWTIV